jgi:hypothetical protein
MDQHDRANRPHCCKYARNQTFPTFKQLIHVQLEIIWLTYSHKNFVYPKISYGHKIPMKWDGTSNCTYTCKRSLKTAQIYKDYFNFLQKVPK